jgi:hypothetical protein
MRKSTVFILLFFLISLKMSTVAAQINRLNSLIIDSTDYNFNKPIIFRAGIHLPFGTQPFVSGEIKLLKRITLNIQIGASIEDGDPTWNVTNPAELADSDKIGVSGFISPELRYFYNRANRIPKTNAPLFGFSGAYIALKYFASTPSSKINSAANFSYENVSAWQLNVGSQIQWNRHCFVGIYAGAVLGKHPIQDGLVSVIPLLQFGFTLGYVF